MYERLSAREGKFTHVQDAWLEAEPFAPPLTTYWNHPGISTPPHLDPTSEQWNQLSEGGQGFCVGKAP